MSLQHWKTSFSQFGWTFYFILLISPDLKGFLPQNNYCSLTFFFFFFLFTLNDFQFKESLSLDLVLVCCFASLHPVSTHTLVWYIQTAGRERRLFTLLSSCQHWQLIRRRGFSAFSSWQHLNSWVFLVPPLSPHVPANLARAEGKEMAGLGGKNLIKQIL